MRKISIRFEEEFYHFLESVEVYDFVEVFYNGLGLDPEQWLEEQEVELTEQTRFSLLRMKVPLPEGLQNLQTWVCRLEERDEFVLFWVGDFAWHGWVQRWFCRKMYLRPLPDLPNLPSLSLAGCKSLRDLGPLSGLQALTSLDLSCCDSLNDLSPLCGLLALSSLKLGECVSLSDLSPLSGLPALKDLDLRLCDSLSDLSPLSGLQHLSSLHLGCCKFLSDLSTLRGLTALTSLDLTYCDYLRDLSPLSGLRALTSLNLTGWRSLIDLGPLSGLTALTSLDLSNCSALSDLGPLSGLTALTSLNLTGWRSLIDLGPLSGLTALTSLDLSNCSALSDLGPLSGLTALTSLKLEWCESLRDISPLSRLTALSSLELGSCPSLSDLSPLSGLLALTSLKLEWYKSLRDLGPLSALTALTSLDLSNCSALSDLRPLSGLQALSLLNLDECKSLKDLGPLSGLTVLRSLTFSSRRVQSIETLRGISSLRELSEFNPPEIAELLAHAAFLRSDRCHIRAQGKSWLEQARGWLNGPPDLQDRFAATLGDCFSLLGGSSLGIDYEAFLKSRPDFSVAPWKAWLGGTLRESGFDLYRHQLEWLAMSRLLPSAVGGVCATLPIEVDPTWSRHWLAELENGRLADAKALLRVAPEICLAHARLGEMAALGRWLAQFTDPSDLAALDPVHAALAQFQFATGNSEAAENHLCAIQSPAHRDPVLAEWVTAMAERDLEQASAKLLRIETPALRADLAERLAAKAGASESTLQRLVVAVGDSPADLANLIHRLLDPGSKDFLRNISRTLQPSRKNTLLKVAEALRREADRLPAEPSVLTPNREL